MILMVLVIVVVVAARILREVSEGQIVVVVAGDYLDCLIP